MSCGVPLPMQEDIVVKDVGAVRMFSSSDPLFSSYIEKFKQEAKSTLKVDSFDVGDIPINFGDTESDLYQGVCFVYADGEKEIIIRKSWWQEAGEDYKVSLIFHELGHCRLDRSHKDSVYTLSNGDEYKVSLMNSVILSPNDFKNFYKEYLKELFTGDEETIVNAFKALE